jgi:hypothetical protein
MGARFHDFRGGTVQGIQDGEILTESAKDLEQLSYLESYKDMNDTFREASTTAITKWK